MDILWWRHGGVCHWVWGFGFNGISINIKNGMKLIRWIDENEGQDFPMYYGIIYRSNTRYQYRVAIIPLSYILRLFYLLHHCIMDRKNWEKIIANASRESYKIGMREGMSKNQNNLEAYNLGLEAGKESSKRKR